MIRKGTSSSTRLLASSLILAQIVSGCSHLTRQDLSTSEDYAPSLKSHYNGETQLSVLKLPEKESGGFVSSVEKLWLNLINKTPDLGDAKEVGSALSERTTLSISREAKSYFYKESEDGYFPAEHEAILLHILSGFTFAAQGKRREATIEARKAAFYLQNEYGSETPFDDPALRLWLGSLWLYCGEWQHARVDFRVAASLSEKYAYLKNIADSDTPPKSVSLVLAGSGPQIYWAPSMKADVVSGLQSVKFKSNYVSEGLSLISSDGKTRNVVPSGLPTISWYDRHQERDHVIRKVLQQSRYTVEATGAATLAATTQAAGTALAIAIGATGIAGGVAILVYTADALNDLAAYLAILVGASGVFLGKEVYQGSSKAAKRILEAGLSPVSFYRYVRFLPDYVHLAVGTDVGEGASLKTNAGRSFTPLYILKSPDEKTTLNMFYVQGGFYEPVKTNASAEHVIQIKDSNGWILSDGKMSFEEAYRFCEKQAIRTNKDYRLPTNAELKLADSKIFGGDQMITDRVIAAESVWTKTPFINSFTECNHFDTRAKTDHLRSPCNEKRIALCGELGL